MKHGVPKGILTLIGIRHVDLEIKVGAIAEFGVRDDFALHFKHRQAGAIKGNLRGLFLRLELEENGRRHVDCDVSALVLPGVTRAGEIRDPVSAADCRLVEVCRDYLVKMRGNADPQCREREWYI